MPRGRGYSSTPRSYRGSSSGYRGSSSSYRGSSGNYRGSSSSYRGGSSSYRGSSSRGHSSFNGGSSRGYSGSSRRNSFSSSMDSRRGYESRPPKYSSSSERFSRSDEYKSYRSDYGSLSRDRRSPEHKRLRVEAPSSRHESYYGSSRHEPPPPPSYSDRRLSSERHQSSPISRREEFRRPMGPPSKRGSSYRGRISSRGSRGLRFTDRPIRRRLVESSYVIRKRFIPRVSDYSRRLKITRLRSAIVRRGVKRSLKDSDDDEKSKDGDSKDKEVKSEKEDDKKSGDENESGEKKKSKAFIKLLCPHCGLRALTFRKYEIHLRTRSHLIAMRRVALKQKAILAQMRQAQRNSQNELEKNTSDDLGNRTNFCPLCKLNYKQKKAVHQLSESHKNMKKFLMPFCKVCNISFKSPMIYENHCCSVDHIKRKQRMDNSSEASGDDDNLENFTTIDSVGDVDEETEAGEKKEDDKEPPVNVGIEKIRKIEAFYCDLCKMYLQRGDDAEVPKILTRHCKQRVHMQRYIRLKETVDLEKRAEKLQRKDLAEKEAKEKKGLVEGESKDKSKVDDEESKDDKLWADVDKDLGDILAEAETGKSSDEDEDSHVNGERYDRFKLSEKNGEEKLMGTDEEGILDNKLVIKEDDKKK